MKQNFWKTSGVTLIELLVGAGIFSIIMSIASVAGFQIYAGKMKIEKTNELYTESRFLLDRIVREVRVNTIDYYEYFSHNISAYSPDRQSGLSESLDDEYGEHPGAYELFFQYIPLYSDINGKHNISSGVFSWATTERKDDVNLGFFNTGADSFSSSEDEDDSALGGNFMQKDLYLLSPDGLIKTIITKKEYTLNAGTPEEEIIGRIVLLKMKLIDTNSDGQVDEWIRLEEFDNGDGSGKGYNFIPITPENINITSLDIIVSPLDDPYKAFAESIKPSNGENPHIQPHVILKLSAKLSEKRFRGLQGENNEFVLQTAVASRILKSVVFPRL